jgi:trehalose 2-sulfotransferase
MQETTMQPQSSYLVCATPRSGSTLLCEALENTGLAGHPKEYFEALKETGMPRRPKDYFKTLNNKEVLEHLGEYSRLDDDVEHALFWDAATYPGYLARVLEEGTTPNGVFGAKVMWGYLGDFVSNLRLISAYKDMDVPTLFSTVFPNLQYIWVTRRDKVRQAVSLWKAIQTWTWRQEHHSGSAHGPVYQARELRFYFAAVDHLVQLIMAHEVAWLHYFEEAGIQPFTVVYEEFAANYEETAREILQCLHIPIPQHLVFGQRRMKQQANTLSEEWVREYHEIKSQCEQS